MSLQQRIKEFCANPRSDAANFNLAIQYDSINQIASALSFFLRTAELTENKELAYICLLKNHLNFLKQGSRVSLAKDQTYFAQSLLPKRPEAYFLLSKFYETQKQWYESYSQACVGLEVCDFNLPPLFLDVQYPGYYGLLFQKAIAAWWIGRCDESRYLFRYIADNYEVEERYAASIRNNLKNLKGVLYPSTLYSSQNKDTKESLRYKFKNSEEIGVNFSQAYQDMFVLSMLDGKENGTYLEIGSGPPIVNNNTALLEAKFNWKGISIDMDQNFTDEFAKKRKNTVLTRNALEIDYRELLNNAGFGKSIDYLQIDCDPPENSLKALERIPFNEYKFAVITFEHDHYCDESKTIKTRSRNLLAALGYELVIGDVSVDKISSFEDWWVHPELVSRDIIDVMKITRAGVNKAEDYMLGRINDPVVPKKSEPKQLTKSYWKTANSPTMEFTTSIPAKGCIVDCAFCPQRTLVNAYTGEKMMTLENFKLAVDKLPQEIRVTFAGFTEPWLNRDCSDMVLYAHEKGHPVSVFTTGIGMSVEDIKRIKNIPFAGAPNGGFCLHLPDNERIAKHPISKKYIEVLEYIKSIQHEIKNFYVMSMGPVHDEVKHIFPFAHTPEMWSRAGNLLGEAIIKPELAKIKDRFKSIYHGEKDMTCNCEERLYHNVMLPNGDVSLCCMDYGLKYIIGNLYKQDYEDIIPKPFSCFKLCQFCENGIEPEKIQ